MDYTLADLYRSNPIPEMRLLTRPFDFSRIVIESASFQEVPSDDFIRSNELLLSTAAGCAENKSLFTQMIRVAQRAHAAAIVYTLRDERYEPPADAIAFADKIRMPVFTIPWEYRLSDLHAFVVEQIQEKKLRVYKEAQDALLNLFFDSQPLDRAAELISRALGAPAAVEDLQGAVKGRSPAFAGAEEEAVNRLAIRINGELVGYLCLCGPTRDGALTADSEDLEKFILSPLSLWFYRKSIENLTVMKMKNSFVWDLANRNYDSLGEMARQGSKLHFDLSRPYTCAMLQVSPRSAAAQIAEYSSEGSQAASAVETALLAVGKAQGLRIMLADRAMQFVVYVENLPPEPAPGVERFLDEADARLAAALPALQFRWGVSETTLKTPDFGRLFENASLALRYCVSARASRFRFTYEDTREAQIFSILADQPEIHAAAQETLGRLLDAGAGSRTDLMATLSEFIRSNYNTSLTARNLHIQRQSLLYRLEKIESLTGLSLSCHRDLFLLEVYSRIFSDG